METLFGFMVLVPVAVGCIVGLIALVYWSWQAIDDLLAGDYELAVIMGVIILVLMLLGGIIGSIAVSA